MLLKKSGLIGIIFIFLYGSLELYIVYRYPGIRTYNASMHTGGNIIFEIMAWIIFTVTLLQTITWILLSYPNSIFKEKDLSIEIKLKLFYVLINILFLMYIILLSIGYYNSVIFNSSGKFYILQILSLLIGIILNVFSIYRMIVPEDSNDEK